MKKLHQRITQITILPEGEPIFSEMATVLTIEDEAAGEYVTITQPHDGNIRIERREWQSVCEAIDTLMANISEWEEITSDSKNSH